MLGPGLHQPELNQPELNQPELGSGFNQPELSTLLFGSRKKQLEKERIQEAC